MRMEFCLHFDCWADLCLFEFVCLATWFVCQVHVVSLFVWSGVGHFKSGISAYTRLSVHLREIMSSVNQSVRQPGRHPIKQSVSKSVSQPVSQ